MINYYLICVLHSVQNLESGETFAPQFPQNLADDSTELPSNFCLNELNSSSVKRPFSYNSTYFNNSSASLEGFFVFCGISC